MGETPWSRKLDPNGWFDTQSFASYGLKGPRLLAARQVLERWLDALDAGYVELFQPSPFQPDLPVDYVNTAIQQIDKRWAEENRSRGGRVYAPSPDFTHRLAYSQKLALIQELRTALHKNRRPV